MLNISYRRTYENGNCVIASSPSDIFKEKDGCYSDVIVNTLNDSIGCYVSIAGHEKSWPEKRVVQKNDRFTIHYIANGRGTFNDIPIKKGSCFAVFPNQEYSLFNDKNDPLEKYWISLRGPQTTELITNAHFDRLPSVFSFSHGDEVYSLFESMIYTEHPDTDLELYLIGCFNILLSFHKSMAGSTDVSIPFNDAHNYYKIAKDFIGKRYNEKLTVHDIAEHIHISESYLRALFFRFEGRPIGEVISDYKMEAAKSLLKTSEYSVSQISGIIGYSDYSTFSKLFKKRTSLSPTEYRKKHMKRR